MAPDTNDWLWWTNSNTLHARNDTLNQGLLAASMELAVLVGVEIRGLDDVDGENVV